MDLRDGRVVGLHHIQLAMPQGEEEAAEKFYGYLLGLEQISKPPELAPRGGVWFKGVQLEGFHRVYVKDPFDNRIELIEGI